MVSDHKVDITSGCEVDRPADEAWAVISDFARNPEWQGGMRSCAWSTDPPLAVGSRYRQEAAFLGRAIRTTFEVIGLEEAADGRRSVTIDTVEGTFPITVTRTVEPLGAQRCRVSAHVRGSPDGLMGVLSPLTKPMVRRAVDRDYARLKQLLET